MLNPATKFHVMLSSIMSSWKRSAPKGVRECIWVCIDRWMIIKLTPKILRILSYHVMHVRTIIIDNYEHATGRSPRGNNFNFDVNISPKSRFFDHNLQQVWIIRKLKKPFLPISERCCRSHKISQHIWDIARSVWQLKTIVMNHCIKPIIKPSKLITQNSGVEEVHQWIFNIKLKRI